MMTLLFFTRRRFQWLLFGIVALASCGDLKNESAGIARDQISTSEWDAVAGRRVFFGHQSVGENILSGVRALARQDRVNLAVTEFSNAASSPGIVHFKIGKNEYPLSKIKDFENTMRSAGAQGADVALMKFCYLDIRSDTDVKALADAYISSLNTLSLQFPKTTFIAVTSPLTTVQNGTKAWLKQVFGRTPSGYAENARRRDFNKIVRDKYAGQGYLFDLARIESEGATRFEYEAGSFEALNPAITSDGGHLNSQGQSVVAAKLLKFIAKLPNRSY